MSFFEPTTEYSCKVSGVLFVIFLFSFLVPSYLFLFMQIGYADIQTDKSLYDGERYFVVAASFYMFVPTVFSIILFIGVLHKDARTLKFYIIQGCITFCILCVVALIGFILQACGGTIYILYPSIITGILDLLPVVYGIYIAYKERKKATQVADSHHE